MATIPPPALTERITYYTGGVGSGSAYHLASTLIIDESGPPYWYPVDLGSRGPANTFLLMDMYIEGDTASESDFTGQGWTLVARVSAEDVWLLDDSPITGYATTELWWHPHPTGTVDAPDFNTDGTTNLFYGWTLLTLDSNSPLLDDIDTAGADTAVVDDTGGPQTVTLHPTGNYGRLPHPGPFPNGQSSLTVGCRQPDPDSVLQTLFELGDSGLPTGSDPWVLPTQIADGTDTVSVAFLGPPDGHDGQWRLISVAVPASIFVPTSGGWHKGTRSIGSPANW